MSTNLIRRLRSWRSGALIVLCLGVFSSSAVGSLAPGPYPGPEPELGGPCANVYRDGGDGTFIPGTTRGDRILGRGGPDTITGDASNDCLIGGSGRDDLRGDAGGDLVRGGPQGDILVGGGGHDSLRGGPGADQLYAEDGVAETIRCGAGFDRVYTADAADELRDCELSPDDFEIVPAPPGY